MTRHGGWPLANSQLGTEAPSLNLKELNSANNHESSEVTPSPVKPSDETLAAANTLTAA